jgi:hypothetical protein
MSNLVVEMQPGNQPPLLQGTRWLALRSRIPLIMMEATPQEQ